MISDDEQPRIITLPVLLIIILPVFSTMHDYLWFSGVIPWKSSESYDFLDLLIRGAVYSLVFLFTLPPPLSHANLLFYATLLSWHSKLHGMPSHAIYLEDLELVHREQYLMTCALYQRFLIFKFLMFNLT